MNGLKTALLLGLLSSVLLFAGQMIGGTRGLQMALVMAVAMNFISYFFSEKIALMSYSAQPVTPESHPEIYRRVGPMVQGLCQRMGIPVPKLWLIPDDSPNAFATGRNPSHSSVAFTYGLLEIMNDQELAGVIAHELGHVKNRDILISSVAATIAAAITYVAQFAFFFGGRHDDEDEGTNPVAAILILVLGPIAAMLIQMAISRSREFSADAAAAQYTGNPDYLINALRKLEGWSKRVPLEANPATAHMFIIKPFSGQALASMFSTHPATEKRIEALAALRSQTPAYTR